MCRVMAIRAASICRLVTYECSTAWMPYSPNVTLVPPLAAPCRSGRCCLRCLTRRGISMTQPSPPVVVPAVGSALAVAGVVASGVAAGPVVGGSVLDGAVLAGAVLDGAVLDGAVLDGAA